MTTRLLSEWYNMRQNELSNYEQNVLNVLSELFIVTTDKVWDDILLTIGYNEERNSVSITCYKRILQNTNPQIRNTDLIGKRIKLLSMDNDPNPVPDGMEGTVIHIGGGIINVDWDNGRSLGVVEGVDKYTILN